MIKKLKDRKVLVFSHTCLVGTMWNVERWSYQTDF